MSKRALLDNYLLRASVLVVERLAGLVIVPLLLANIGLDGYGYYGLAMSLVLVVSNVFSVRLPMATIRFYPGVRAEAGPVLAAGILFWIGLTLVCVAGIAVAPRLLSRVTFASPDRQLLLVFAVAAGLLAVLYELVSGALRAENKFGALSIVDMLERVIFIVACLVAFHLGHRSVEAALGILIVTNAIRILLVLRPALRDVRWRAPSWGLLRGMVVFCLPFVPHLASVWVIERSLFLLVAQRLGEQSTGMMTLAFAFCGLLLAAVLPLQATLYPMLSRAYDEGRRNDVDELVNLSMRLALASSSIGTITLALGVRPALEFLGFEDATPPMLLLVVLALAFGLGGVRQVVINLLHIEKRTQALLTISPLGALVSVACGWTLVGSLGLVGPALGMLAGTAVQVLGMLHRTSGFRGVYPTPSFLLGLAGASTVAFLFQATAAQFGPHWYAAAAFVSVLLFGGVLFVCGGVTTEERQALRNRFKRR